MADDRTRLAGVSIGDTAKGMIDRLGGNVQTLP
jgi:hypothetical protein